MHIALYISSYFKFCIDYTVASVLHKISFQQLIQSIGYLAVLFLLNRIRGKIIDPYNKIVARTAQLARLQVYY